MLAAGMNRTPLMSSCRSLPSGSASVRFSMSRSRTWFPQKFRGLGPEHSALPLASLTFPGSADTLLKEAFGLGLVPAPPVGQGQKEEVAGVSPFVHRD